MHLTQNSISEIVGISVATVRNWCKKFIDLLNKAKKLFSTGFEKIGEAIRKVRLTNKDSQIEWEVSPIMNPSGYVVEMWNGNKLLWLKVGMTNRPARERMKEHLQYWESKKDEAGNPIYKNLHIKVKALYPAISQEGAEITESALRECYKEKYPENFIPNDRFYQIAYKGIEKLSERFNALRSFVETAPILEGT